MAVTGAFPIVGTGRERDLNDFIITFQATRLARLINVSAKNNLALVLVSSDVARMLRIRFYSQPLYGWFFQAWKFSPLPFASLQAWFPDYTRLERLELYGVLGGLPGYLEQLDPAQSFFWNIQNRLLAPSGFFRSEPPAFLHSLGLAGKVYASVLRGLVDSWVVAQIVQDRLGFQHDPLADCWFLEADTAEILAISISERGILLGSVVEIGQPVDAAGGREFAERIRLAEPTYGRPWNLRVVLFLLVRLYGSCPSTSQVE